MATIGSHYVRAAVVGATGRGISIESLLRNTGINPLLLNDAKGRVDTSQMTTLIKNIWRQLQDEFMGFTPRPCRNGVFALMTDYVREAANLRGLLKRGIHFYNLFTDDIQMKLTVSRGKAVMSFAFRDPGCDPNHFFSEFWMVIWHRFASWYIGEGIHLYETRLNYPQPDYLSELRLTFPCPLVFNRPRNELVFDPLYLEKPLIRDQDDLAVFLGNSPQLLMTMPGEDKSLTAQLKKRLFNRDQLVLPSLEQIAAEFSVTPQTLNNRLKKEHTRYQQIKDAIRRDIAIDKLVNERLSVEKIAALLGFKEARSFTRAFKKWTGASPSRYWQVREGADRGV